MVIAAQNNAVRTVLNHKFIRRNQIANVGLCGDRDETVNHIISERRK